MYKTTWLSNLQELTFTDKEWGSGVGGDGVLKS